MSSKSALHTAVWGDDYEAVVKELQQEPAQLNQSYVRVPVSSPAPHPRTRAPRGQSAAIHTVLGGVHACTRAHMRVVDSTGPLYAAPARGVTPT